LVILLLIFKKTIYLNSKINKTLLSSEMYNLKIFIVKMSQFDKDKQSLTFPVTSLLRHRFRWRSHLLFLTVEREHIVAVEFFV